MKRIDVHDSVCGRWLMDSTESIEAYAPYILAVPLMLLVGAIALVIGLIEVTLRWALIPQRWRE